MGVSCGGESEVETFVEVVDAGFLHGMVDVFTEVVRVFTRVVAELEVEFGTHAAFMSSRWCLNSIPREFYSSP